MAHFTTNRLFLSAIAITTLGLATTSSEATLLVDVNFDQVNEPGGTFSAGNIGVEGFFLVSGGVGTTVNAAPGLEGGGALSIENPGRINANIQASVAAQIGVDGTSIYGRYLVNNPTTTSGFTGIELDQGNFDTNRVIVLGEANGSGEDFAVVDLNPGNGPDTNAENAGEGVDLALPAVVGGQTREIFFRIDYTGGQDTFNLINSDGTVISSANGNDLSFSRIGFAAFGGAPAIVYDEFELGTTLDSVGGVPEPTSLALLGLGGLLIARRRRS
ncbi:MAG: PEP-CTERM sorting domain-containing protein [Planctomycetota bacterium]